jgi:hypothetical protein
MKRDLHLLAGAVFLGGGDLLAIITLALEVHALTGSALAVGPGALAAATCALIGLRRPLAPVPIPEVT